jgi:hypothetical protein
LVHHNAWSLTHFRRCHTAPPVGAGTGLSCTLIRRFLP